MYFYLCFLLCVPTAFALFEGDVCTKNGSPGVCRTIMQCKSAIEDIQKRINPQLCAFDGSTPIVCCVDKGGSPATTPPPTVVTAAPTRPPRPVATTQPPSRTTTEYIPPVNDYHSAVSSGTCRPIAANLTSKKTGQKSWDKCIEYQEQLIFPCAKSVTLTGELSRANNCKHNTNALIFGGENAGFAEYPHMALLGFGPRDNTQWLCGGSLISDRFILTAGHCTSTRDLGVVTFAILGTLKRSDPLSDGQLYGISRIIKPDVYKPPSKYNDIALLQTDAQVQLNEFIVPACLHIGNPVEDDKASATGWGVTQTRGSVADWMQKVTIAKFTTEECSDNYGPSRLLINGFDPKTQICYGDKKVSKDTCQGDSGGPLQIKSKHVFCMWTIIGVTSFGKECGIVGTPGIYTKVSDFLPWIESIVWA